MNLIAAIAVGAAPSFDSASPEELQLALTAAALYGDASAIRALIARGADPNAHSPQNFHAHATPLHQAVWYGHLDAVRALVESGARLDVYDSAHQGTPLDWADYAERTEIALNLRRQSSR